MRKVIFFRALISFYVSGADSLQNDHALCRGARALLQRAAQAAQAKGDDAEEGAEAAGLDEAGELSWFAREGGLMVDAEKVRPFMRENAMKGGSEHRVALWRGRRVLKDLDVQSKATESLFDYLTDHLLANHFFGDDVRLEGFYEYDGRLHVVISQPFVEGQHPVWRELVEGLEGQGLVHESPQSRLPTFLMDGGPAGQMTVIDLHVNNVIVAKQGGVLHPIDAHFYFDDQAARVEALEKLGLLDETKKC